MPVPANISLNFINNIANTIQDKNNKGTGFTSVYPNSDNTQYDKTQLEAFSASTTQGFMDIVPGTGVLMGTATVKNALRVAADLTKTVRVRQRIDLPAFRNYTANSTNNGVFHGILLGAGLDWFLHASLEMMVDPAATTTYKWFLRVKRKDGATSAGTIIAQYNVHTAFTSTSNNFLDIELRWNSQTKKASFWYKFEAATAVLNSDIWTPTQTQIDNIFKAASNVGIVTRRPSATSGGILSIQTFNLEYFHVEVSGISGVQPAKTSGEVSAATNTTTPPAELNGTPTASLATSSGSLNTGVKITGNVQALPSNTAGSLSTNLALRGSPVALPAILSASASTGINLNGNVHALPPTITGSLTTGVKVNGSPIAQPATLSASASTGINVNGNVQALPPTTTGSLSTGVKVNGTPTAQPATLSASVTAGITISGNIQALPATTVGSLTNGASFSGSPVAQPAILSGSASAGINLKGNAEALPATISASAITGINLRGNVQAIPATTAGSLTTGVKVNGTSIAQPATISANATATGILEISGDITSSPATVNGDISAAGQTSELTGRVFANEATTQGNLKAGFALVASGSPFARRATTFPTFKMVAGVNVVGNIAAQRAGGTFQASVYIAPTEVIGNVTVQPAKVTSVAFVKSSDIVISGQIVKGNFATVQGSMLALILNTKIFSAKSTPELAQTTPTAQLDTLSFIIRAEAQNQGSVRIVDNNPKAKTNE
jgi:hypothetical protein